MCAHARCMLTLPPQKHLRDTGLCVGWCDSDSAGMGTGGRNRPELTSAQRDRARPGDTVGISEKGNKWLRGQGRSGSPWPSSAGPCSNVALRSMDLRSKNASWVEKGGWPDTGVCVRVT